MGLGYVDKTLDDCHRQMFPHRDEGEDSGKGGHQSSDANPPTGMLSPQTV